MSVAPTQTVHVEKSGIEQLGVDIIAKQKKDNTKYAVNNAIAGGVGLGIYAVASLLFPPVAFVNFVGTVGLIYSALKGWNIVEAFGRERSLEKAKQELTQGRSFLKTAARAEKTKKWHNRLSNLTLGVLGVGLAAVVATLIAPVAIPAALTGPIFSAAVYTGLVTITAETFMNGVRKAAASVVNAGTDTMEAVLAPKTAPESNAPAAVANTPSPGVSFEKAANGNEAPKAAAPEVAPVVKLDAPKL